MYFHLWFQKSYRRVLTFSLPLMLILLVAFGLAKAQDFYRAEGRDFFSFWLGSHMLVSGESPYDPDAWRAGHEFYGGLKTSTASVRAYGYQLPLAVLFAPLGLLPLEWAAVLSAAFSLMAVIFSLQLVLNTAGTPIALKYLLPTAAGVFLFRPVAVTLYLGQIDTIILFLICVSLWFWQRKQWFWGGFLLALTELKPNIGPPLLLFMGLWLLYQRKWKAILGIGAAGGALFGLGCFFDPEWVQHWLATLNGFVENRMGNTPTVWGFTNWLCSLNQACSMPISIITMIVLSLGLIAALLQIKSDQPQTAVGLIIPVVLMITPYLWVYSQSILLLPLLLSWQKLINFDVPYLLKASFFIFIDLFAIILVLGSISIGADVITILVPAVTIGIFLLVGRVEARSRAI